MKYKSLNKPNTSYAVICDSGDDALDAMKTFVNNLNLKTGRFTAIGAFSSAILGYFDFSIKDYKKIPVNEQVEVLSLLGDVALHNNEPKIHAHVVLGKSGGHAIGGHLLKATVHPTLEIIVDVSEHVLRRKMDDMSGLPLINIE